MSWDTEGTKQKILKAAISEFALHGPDGTTVDKIAKIAGVNKERIYNYFGAKRDLFAVVLSNELIKVAQSVPLKSFEEEDIAEYAGRVYDYHCVHPELSRLLLWEGLIYSSQEVPNENIRCENYNCKIEAIKKEQDEGRVTDEIEASYLTFLILALANSWFMLPQVARMFTPIEDIDNPHEKRRAIIIEAAKRLLVK
ncbi:TetR family transcriptional regulator [Acinetobacter oleivorans]|uniref:TetR family transcriptional regulator n=1 Tax=Acinetobacter oleivorans TaxID=1148157 RepID=A0ABR9NMP8_9GAMM|nr:TetR family transcriptional regulator [Acinetobacter oleivorans]MBE2165988.1 TetR family transcriptional regulator [Acinetobacter oleivorans]MBJ9741405.1 TetR family transcriptional regulator [Acinetobacter oleivorans]MCU4411089.1 TetR family transcriptional regulator [Acinetobacter oleivorans]